MSQRATKALIVLLVALLATVGGALVGWAVLLMNGGVVFTRTPPSLSLVQRTSPDGALAEHGQASGDLRHVVRRRPPQGSNRPERLAEGVTPRLAIVIDDIGQSLSAPRELLRLQVPITFSVLPDLPHSRGAAELIAQGRREFIIHLPMEPVDYPVHDPGPSPLLLSQNEQVLRQRIEAYLRELPGATGASNHMGSAYTADPGRMAVVQQMLAEHSLFFLNSKTSASPVPAEIARKGRYAYLERDVFLDNDRDERLIARALDQAFARARRRGYAIAIGHPYPETMQVLRAILTGPDVRGVELVSLSELLQR